MRSPRHSPLVILAIAAAASCSFSGAPPSGGESRDGGEVDSGGAIDGPMRCEWGFAPRHVSDVCALAAGAPIEILEDQTINTDTDVDSLGLAIVSNADGVDVARWLVRDFRVVANLRVRGSRPLMIVSQTTIAVIGSIDLRGRLDQRAAGADIGAHCVDSTGKRGTDGNGGAGAGGGAGFGAAGARGETGNSDGDGDGLLPGGLGGIAVGGEPIFSGGCKGGLGGEPPGSGSGGAGGNGGGAIHLVARESISVTGVISAGGEGGRPGVNRSDAAGGGGGSGGYVGLESPEVSVVDGFVAANGGGGGGGTSSADDGEEPGESGRADEVPAAGGQGARMGLGNDNGGGDGGTGGARGTAAATPSSEPIGAAGGGGGGVGMIVVISASTPDQASFSPPFSLLSAIEL